MRNKQTLMTSGPIGKQMIAFTAPLFLGNLFQQLYNTADALIVGRMLGDEALGAVSSTGSLVFLLISFFTGISMGAGVAISRYFGAREPEKLEKAVHTNVALGLVGTVLLTAIGVLLTPWLLQIMGTPEDIFDDAVLYVQILFAGCVGMIFYNTFRGIMQAVGDGVNPLKYLIISSLTNIVLDITFIAVFHGGVGSAALATVISQSFSAVLCMIKLMKTDAEYRFDPKKLAIDWSMAKEMLHYGIPSGMQNSVIALANVVVQSNINAFGTAAVAGLGAYSKIEGFAFLPVTSFNIALTTFVGQNLGAGEHERAKKGARFGIFWAVVLAELIGGLMAVFAPNLISAFTDGKEAIAFGVQKVRICGPFFFLLSATHSLSAVLRGAGKSVIPMIAMLSFWCVVRVSFLSIFVPMYHDIALVNWVYPLTWCLSAIFLSVYYLRADWIYSFEKKNQ